jgi:hypothetical protein
LHSGNTDNDLKREFGQFLDSKASGFSNLHQVSILSEETTGYQARLGNSLYCRLCLLERCEMRDIRRQRLQALRFQAEQGNA